MKKILWFLAAASIVTASLVLAACGDTSSTAIPDTTKAPPDPNGTGSTVPDTDSAPAGLPLTGYTTLFYGERASKDLLTATAAFQRELSRLTQVSATAKSYTGADKNTPSFLLGDTGHALSSLAKEKARKNMEGMGTDKHGYAVVFTEDAIVINGSDDAAVMAGMKFFLENFAATADRQHIDARPGQDFVRTFGDELRIFPTLVQWELELVSTVEQPPADQVGATMKYPCLIELNHQSDPTQNGVLIATGERWIGDRLCPIYRSRDKGETWEHVTGLVDTFHPGFRTAFAPSVFELPRAVGNMPEGTLIAGVDSINADWTRIHIVLFRSFDGGDTWECFASLADGGSGLGKKGGVWEPYFVCTDDGTLICHYSDEVNSPCSQMLVYRSTTDGENWSDIVPTVELTQSPGLRPGMPVITRLTDGRYMMVYEIVGLAGNPVYGRYSNDGLDWDAPTDKGVLIRSQDRKTLAATPWVAHSSIETVQKEGMLVLTGWRMASGSSTTGSDIFVSFDSGKKWIAIPNFYSYVYTNDNDTWGYSVCTFFSSDGKTMYYMANPKGDTDRSTWFTLFRIRIS